MLPSASLCSRGSRGFTFQPQIWCSSAVSQAERQNDAKVKPAPVRALPLAACRAARQQQVASVNKNLKMFASRSPPALVKSGVTSMKAGKERDGF